MTYSRNRGFSLVELVIVVAITLVVAAVAIPRIMGSIYNIRLRSGISSLSGLIQTGRMWSVKQNRSYQVHFTTAGTSALAYVDLNADNNPQSTEPQVQLGGTIVKSSTLSGGPTALDATILGWTPTGGTADPAFNPRGIPCAAGGSCPAGLVYYFTDNRPTGINGWAAVSISPAGRVKTWIWTGSTWGD